MTVSKPVTHLDKKVKWDRYLSPRCWKFKWALSVIPPGDLTSWGKNWMSGGSPQDSWPGNVLDHSYIHLLEEEELIWTLSKKWPSKVFSSVFAGRVTAKHLSSTSTAVTPPIFETEVTRTDIKGRCELMKEPPLQGHSPTLQFTVLFNLSSQ